MKIYFLLAIAGICILYSISFLSKPIEIELKDLWKYEGKNVVVRGIVRNVIGKLVEIGDGKTTAKIYFDGNGKIEYGDEIIAIGKVGKFGNEYVLYADEIKIFKEWERNETSLPYLAENFEKYVGMNVNVSGFVYSSYKNFFYLTDEHLNYKIKVYYNKSKLLKEGDRVKVRALFYYDSSNLCFYLKIKEKYHGVDKYE